MGYEVLGEYEMMILVLSLVAGMVVVGGLWMATRDTKPVESVAATPPPRTSLLMHNKFDE